MFNLILLALKFVAKYITGILPHPQTAPEQTAVSRLIEMQSRRLQVRVSVQNISCHFSHHVCLTEQLKLQLSGQRSRSGGNDELRQVIWE